MAFTCLLIQDRFILNMSEFIHPYSLNENDEQYKLHVGRYKWAAEMIKGMVVANAACSTNYGSDFLKTFGRLVIGFDRNPHALEIARKEGRNLVIDKDIQDETFEGFTTLVCLETFEHLKEPWKFLENLHPTVKEIVISVPCIPTKHFNEWHLHDFTIESFKEGIRERGWNIIHEARQDESWLPKPTYIMVYATR